jgi:hypothetical protein
MSRIRDLFHAVYSRTQCALLNTRNGPKIKGVSSTVASGIIARYPQIRWFCNVGSLKTTVEAGYV